MKKKFIVPTQDREDWLDFTKQPGTIYPKESDFLNQNAESNKVPKLDLHGVSLSSSNEIVKKFIIKSFKLGHKKILIITGKGSRSKSYDDPYVSEKLSILRNHVPEFIKSDENLKSKILKIEDADKKSGGEGAFFIFLKRNI